MLYSRRPVLEYRILKAVPKSVVVVTSLVVVRIVFAVDIALSVLNGDPAAF